MKKILTILTIIVFIGAAYFISKENEVQKPESLDLGTDLGINVYGYNCTDNMQMNLIPNEDLSSILIIFGENEMSFDKQLDGSYKGMNIDIYPDGEILNITSGLEKISCIPVINQEKAPLNFGGSYGG